MPTPIDRIAAPLFVPASHPERFLKAVTSGADAVIIDLEDAVAASEKDSAREVLRHALPDLAAARQERFDGQPGKTVALGVRINSATTDLMPSDVEMIAATREHLDYVVLPEVQGTEDLQKLQDLLEAQGVSEVPPVVALIESSRGLLNATAIAEHPTVRRLALGSADLSKEWEIEPSSDEAEFDIARQTLVIASRAAGLVGPLDNPHMNVRDPEGLARRVTAIAQLGMKGKQCIHPNQTETVLNTFLISNAEYGRLEELVRIFEASEKEGVSSIQLNDGSFVDYPVYHRAVQQIIAYEKTYGGRPT